MDPLTLLREYSINNNLHLITQTSTTFHFGSQHTFPLHTSTAFRSKQGGHYSLATLLFFLRHHHLKHTDYLQSARLNQVPPITLPDRKPLLEYLTGVTASCGSIDPVVGFSLNDEYRPEEAGDDVAEVPEENMLDTADYVSMIRALERPLKDREALLEAKNRDFFSVLIASTRREEERQRSEAQQRKDGVVAKSRLVGMSNEDRPDEKAIAQAGPGSVPKQAVRMKGVPIILVPSASQTLITIYNVREFLEDGIFVPSDVKAKSMKGARPDCVTVQKKLSRDRAGAVGAYEVRDKPSVLKAEDWERVVAVFVLGKEWQFKDWPFKDHVEIFNKIIGFYIRFEDDSVESAKVVKQWNVKIISISKNKRHQDRAAALEVWDRLEAFMRSR
ncbi:hypothetical protein LUZ60_005366 [Juncus effusus]|nr:hypothetical protein LUZ60_005366 [Juncus effusus]